VKVKFADFRVITRSRTHPKPVSEHAQLNQVSLNLIRLIFPVEKGIRLVGVTMSSFEEAADRQDSGLPLLRPGICAANSCGPVLAGTGR
jgi:DNA polymerase-4